jgi:hypothetical protein
MRLRRSFLLLTLAVALLPACGPKDVTTVPTPPQTRVAKYGGDVMASVLTIAQQTAVLQQSRVLKTPDAANIMIAANKMGAVGLKLSGYLSAYDTAMDIVTRTKTKADIEAALVDLETLLGSVIPPPAGPKIVEAFRAIREIITMIRGTLAPVPA